MRFSLLVAALSLALFACDDHDHDDHDHDHGAEGLDAHACEHVTAGPYADVTAAASHEAAVESFEPHHMTRVELVSMPSGSLGGFVQVTPPKSGHFRLVLDTDVPVMLHSADNMHMDWEGSGAPDGCDPAAKTYQAPELSQATPYLLVFGPTDAESVGFVMAHEDHYASEGHEDEGDDHAHEGEDHAHE